VVDDEEANLTVLQAILADLGHPIVTARSAQETFRHLLQDEFAVILLDIKMPDLNGLELAALLHQREQASLTPIIFITAHYDDAESVASSYRAGGVDYLVKPVNPDILRAKVRVFVQLAQARSQLAAENAERRRAESSLQRLNAELEQRVAHRTADLTRANDSLIREVAERKQAEAALRETKEELARSNLHLEELVRERTAKLQEMIGELEHFSYSITHDMRAPLRAMQGFATMLEDLCAKCPGQERKTYLRRIATAASRMDCLITDALSYSKAVRENLALVPVDAAALLRGILESYPSLQPPKACVRVEENIPMVLGNEAGLIQCFSNLLDNAAKFIKPGQRAQVRVWAEVREDAEGRGRGDTETPSPASGPFVRIWIEDHGIGIPESFQPQLFRMFQRGSRDYEGTGIGLALVRKVVERMGGGVGVESKPGHGSRFWLDLRPAGEPGLNTQAKTGFIAKG